MIVQNCAILGLKIRVSVGIGTRPANALRINPHLPTARLLSERADCPWPPTTWLLIQFGRDVRMIFPEPIIGCGFTVVVPCVNIRPELK